MARRKILVPESFSGSKVDTRNFPVTFSLKSQILPKNGPVFDKYLWLVLFNLWINDDIFISYFR